MQADKSGMVTVQRLKDILNVSRMQCRVVDWGGNADGSAARAGWRQPVQRLKDILNVSNIYNIYLWFGVIVRMGGSLRNCGTGRAAI